MKKQVVFIHGGTTFDTDKESLLHLKNLKIDLDRYRKHGWSSSLQEKLGQRFDVLLLRMPNPMNSKYKEWEILLKKIEPLLDKNLILLGHSLGAIFLAKYLSKNKFSKKILATFLISPPYDREGMEESLGGFVLPKSLSGLNKQGGRIFLYHSQDDSIVPFGHQEEYQKALPNAVRRIFKNRGHFNQEKFPELIRDIKGL